MRYALCSIKLVEIKREKKPNFSNVIICTDIVTSNPSFLFVLFFFLFLYLFSSSPAVMPHTSHLQERSPTSIALFFLQSISHLDAYCVLVYIACWPLDRRILHELYFACAATSRVPPALDKEWFHHLANGIQLHAFSQSRAFLCLVVHAHSIGDRHTETSSCGRKKRRKKHRWYCMFFQGATSFPCFAMVGNWRVHRLLGTRRKVKSFRGSAHCKERC